MNKKTEIQKTQQKMDEVIVEIEFLEKSECENRICKLKKYYKKLKNKLFKLKKI